MNMAMPMQPAFGGAKLGGAFLKCGRLEVGRGKLEATLFLDEQNLRNVLSFVVLRLSLRIRLLNCATKQPPKPSLSPSSP